MDLNWLETLLFGFVSGLADILPVSARAHNILLLKVFGAQNQSGLQYLLIHISELAALYSVSRSQLVKMARARALAQIPKRRRKRPLDVKSLMDYRFLRTMLLPVVVAYLAYGKVNSLNFSLMALAGLIFLNGLVLYIPQFLPGSNKDARTLSRLDGLYMGLGGALSILPGFSGIGTAVSIGAVRGVEPGYALNMTLIMNMAVTIGLIVYDILAIITGGLGGLTAMMLLRYLVTAAAAFLGTILGIRMMKNMASGSGYSVFAYYCWGVALFTFILNLMA